MPEPGFQAFHSRTPLSLPKFSREPFPDYKERGRRMLFSAGRPAEIVISLGKKERLQAANMHARPSVCQALCAGGRGYEDR